MMHRSPRVGHAVMRRRRSSRHKSSTLLAQGWRRGPSRLQPQRRRGAGIAAAAATGDTRRSRRSRASRPRPSARRRCGRRSPSLGSPSSASEAARPGSERPAGGPWGPWALLMGVEAAGCCLEAFARKSRACSQCPRRRNEAQRASLTLGSRQLSDVWARRTIAPSRVAVVLVKETASGGVF